MRRSRKLPIATADGDADLIIKEADWRRMESAYEQRLLPAVRKAVLEATQMFVLFEVYERTAEPAADAEAIITACSKTAVQFHRTLLTNVFRSSGASVYAAHLIKSKFHDPRLNDNNRLFDALAGVLTSFEVACTTALRDLQDAPAFKEGESWNAWVRRLIRIFEQNGLATGARKDTGNKSRSDKESPFVPFVRELQHSLPPELECRYQRNSDGALAKAIGQARRIVGAGLKKARSASE